MKKDKKRLSGKKFTNRFEKVFTVHEKSNSKPDEMSNTSNKKIGFGRAHRKRVTLPTKGVLEEKNGAFDENPMLVEIIPMVCTARNAGVKAKVFMRVNIRAFVGFVGAGIVANTNGIGRTFDSGGFMTDIFEPR